MELLKVRLQTLEERLEAITMDMQTLEQGKVDRDELEQLMASLHSEQHDQQHDLMKAVQVMSDVRHILSTKVRPATVHLA